MVLDKHVFEARFVKNLSIFEPQIEKHYAYVKKHVGKIYCRRQCRALTHFGPLHVIFHAYFQP